MLLTSGRASTVVAPRRGWRPPRPGVVLAVAGLWVSLLGLTAVAAARRSTSATAALPTASIGGAAGDALGNVVAFCRLHAVPAVDPAGAATSPWSMFGLLGVATMVAAMMVPAALPAVDHVARNSLPRRRPSAVAAFLAAYLGVWTVAVAGTAVALIAIRGPVPAAGHGDVVLFVLLALAAGWHLSPVRRRWLRRCRRARPLATTGWAATRDPAGFGLAYGGRCLLTCGPLMAIMAAGPPAGLAVMAAVTVLAFLERTRPGAALLLARPTAWVLVAAAVAAVPR